MNRNYLAPIAVYGAIGLLVGAAFTLDRAQAQARTEWTYERCWTNQCVQDTLSNLPPDRADAAKLTTWRDTTFVWYRK